MHAGLFTASPAYGIRPLTMPKTMIPTIASQTMVVEMFNQHPLDFRLNHVALFGTSAYGHDAVYPAVPVRIEVAATGVGTPRPVHDELVLVSAGSKEKP